MSDEYTVSVPANIAFIKYWGATDLERAIPCNASISMTLRTCVSHTTVRVLSPGAQDEVWHATEAGLTAADGAFRDRALAHLERLREWAATDRGLAVATRNSFPAAAGIASSILARRSGSGSASRSVMGGYVQWPDGDDPEAPARQLAPASHWDLRDVVVLVQIGAKGVSSLDGHTRAASSPHYERRQALLPYRIAWRRSELRSRRATWNASAP